MIVGRWEHSEADTVSSCELLQSRFRDVSNAALALFRVMLTPRHVGHEIREQVLKSIEAYFTSVVPKLCGSSQKLEEHHGVLFRGLITRRAA